MQFVDGVQTPIWRPKWSNVTRHASEAAISCRVVKKREDRLLFAGFYEGSSTQEIDPRTLFQVP